MKKAKELETCHKKLCKKQLNASLVEAQKVRAAVGALQTRLKNKEIDRKQYMAQLKKVGVNLEQSKETMELMTCALDKCNKQVRGTLEALNTMGKNQCIVLGNKKECLARAQKIDKLLKAPHITQKQYLAALMRK